jgi:hypothetical protein
MQTALHDPSQAEVDALNAHFCTQDVDVAMDDSGLASRKDAYRPGVVRRLETADLVLAIVVGAGMPVGTADDRRPGRFWELIQRTLVAPHFGRYDFRPWLRAFSERVVLGIPDGAMALVVHGRRVRSVGG